MHSDAATVDEYLEGLPSERRESIETVRKVILEHLPDGYEEGMGFGMITYSVPLSRYPETYNKQPLMYAALASQKRHMAVYLSNIYADNGLQEWFVKEYEASGKKMDVGKSCVRFSKLENLPLELIGEAVGRTSVDEFIEMYEQARQKTKK